MSKEYTIRVMTLEDYDEVYALWMGIQPVLVSVPSMIPKEGVERFLKEIRPHQYGSGSRWKDRGSHSLADCYHCLLFLHL